METLKQIILKGVLKDVLLAERSYTLNKEINISHSKITKGVDADISWILYDLSYTEMVLSLCRIYDTPNKRFPTRCLKQIYQVIKESDYDLDIPNRDDVLLQSPCLDIPDSIIKLLHESSKKEFNKRAVAYFETEEINEPIATARDTLKTVRDKLLAHNEDVSIDTLIHYENIEVLLKHAQNAIAFFSLGYCGRHLKASDRFYLSSSARKWQYSFKKFVERQNGR
jgi:hypothetical protein